MFLLKVELRLHLTTMRHTPPALLIAERRHSRPVARTGIYTRSIRAFGLPLALGFLSMWLCGSPAAGQTISTNAPEAVVPASKFRSAEDGCLDVSGFLDEAYGFLPVIFPITEPAVGYGVAGGPALISRPSEDARPNITFLGGMGTQNGSWGTVAGDSRNWLDDRLQTLVGVVYASVNLDYYGIGENSVLADHPLRYNLEPKGGLVQSKYRIGDSHFLAGISYAFASTDVSFEAPVGTPNLPDFRNKSNVGGVGPSLTYDSRDNIFTPTRGTYVEATIGLFSKALGGDDEFQRLQIIAMNYQQLCPKVFLGVRGQFASTFGDTPFYMRPFISMRGIPSMRYQGEEIAQIETELRWQFWKRFSLVGFVGGGASWNDFKRFEKSQAVVAGGTGFRYEISRKYGIHMGMDVAFGPDDTAIYVQVGSAWARP